MARKISVFTALNKIKAIAKQIDLLAPYSQEIADKYVKKIWQLYTHHKPKLPISIKRSFCRKCLSFWKQGKTVRIRFKNGKKIYTCLVCGAIKRVPFKK
jgi:ribonuclease P protein subunit RPR2